LALPAFYAIFNFLTVGLLSLVDYVLQNFVFGFAGITGAWPAMERLSPAYHLVKALKVSYERKTNVITDVVFNGMPTIAIYAAAGLLLAALALLFYRHRSLERAGEVVAMSSLRRSLSTVSHFAARWPSEPCFTRCSVIPGKETPSECWHFCCLADSYAILRRK
jgi:hypothetical protein